MGNVFTVSGNDTLIATTAQELISVEADSANPFKVLAVRIGQDSEEGDSESEMLRIQLGRYTGAPGAAAGSAADVNPHEPGVATATATGYVCSTTMSGTKTVIIEDAWNLQAGYLYVPTPEERIIIAGGTGFFVGAPIGPAGPIALYCSVTIEELMVA